MRSFFISTTCWLSPGVRSPSASLETSTNQSNPTTVFCGCHHRTKVRALLCLRGRCPVREDDPRRYRESHGAGRVTDNPTSGRRFSGLRGIPIMPACIRFSANAGFAALKDEMNVWSVCLGAPPRDHRPRRDLTPRRQRESAGATATRYEAHQRSPEQTNRVHLRGTPAPCPGSGRAPYRPRALLHPVGCRRR